MIEQNVFYIVVGLFMALTWRDLWSPNTANGQLDKPGTPSSAKDIHHHQHHMGLDSADMGLDDVPTTVYEPELTSDHLAHNIEHAPTVKVLYCHSCGYKHAFDETSKLLRQKYPNFRIVGGLHQPSWLRSSLVQLLFLFKIVTMGLIFLNINPFTYLNMATPQFWTYITDHKMYATMLIFLLTQTIEANLMSTGAFEIFYNDIPIWSKIESGRMPSPYELLQTIDAQTNFIHKSKIIPNFTPTT